VAAGGITLVVRDAEGQAALRDAARELLGAIDGLEVAEAAGLPADAEPGRAYVLAAAPGEAERAALRGALEPHALVTQVRYRSTLARQSPLRKKRIARLDLAVVAAQPGREAEALALAADYAERRMGRLCTVSSPEGAPAWEAAVERERSGRPDVEFESLGAGDAAAALVAEPGRFDVVATAPALGDALIGQAIAITGTPTLYAAGVVGAGGAGAYYPFAADPDQPDGFQNPLALALAAGLALHLSLGRDDDGTVIEDAVDLALETGLRTPDIYAEQPGEMRAATQTLQRALMKQLGWALGAEQPEASDGTGSGADAAPADGPADGEPEAGAPPTEGASS